MELRIKTITMKEAKAWHNKIISENYNKDKKPEDHRHDLVWWYKRLDRKKYKADFSRFIEALKEKGIEVESTAYVIFSWVFNIVIITMLALLLHNLVIERYFLK